jgi:GGDEF domain-containing protein
MRRGADGTGAGRDRAPVLEVLSGPRTGALHPLDRDLLLGRGQRADVSLRGAGVSRLHARIEVGPGGPTVRDLSRNGTLLNGAPISEPTALKEGDRLQIGEAAVVRVRWMEPRRATSGGPMRVQGTDAFDRRYLEERTTAEIAYAERAGHDLALMGIQMHGADRYRRRWGDAAFEALERVLVRVLRERVREEDTVARLGPWRVAVLCRALDEEGAERFARRLREAIPERVRSPQDPVLRLPVTVVAAAYVPGEELMTRVESQLPAE